MKRTYLITGGTGFIGSNITNMLLNQGQKVIVYDNNSTSEKITIENPIGHPSRREEAIPLLREKFIRNVQNVLSLEKSMSLWEQVINLEKDDELTKFFNILQDDE